MTRTSPPQVAFSSGEVSPLLHRRFDYQRYQTGVMACRGFLPMPEGALTRAPGTWYRGHSHSDATGRLVPFQFAADDSVVLEFTPGFMRVWRYGSLVMAGGAPYTLATPFDALALRQLRWVQSADVLYLCDGLRPIHRLARYALDSWTLTPQKFDGGPFRVQNLDREKTLWASGSIGEITLNAGFDLFTPAHVGSLLRLVPGSSTMIPAWTSNTQVSIGQKMTNAGNTYSVVGHDAEAFMTGIIEPEVEDPPPSSVEDGNVYWVLIYSGDYPVRRSLTVYALDDRVNFGGYSWRMAGSIGLPIVTNTGVQPPVHIEGSSLSEKSGVIWRFEDDGRGIVRITSVTNARLATATVLRQIPAQCVNEPTYRWSEGAWSEVYGYPSALELMDQRLVAAASRAEPRSLWFSRVGDFADFLDGTEADDPFAYTVSGGGSVNRIVNIHNGRTGLSIFALGEEFSTRAESRNQTIGPTNVVFGRDGGIGSSPARPISPNGDPIFISRDRRRLHSIAYSLEADGNRSVDLTRAARHLGAEKFEEIVWQGVPLTVAWLRTAAGNLVAMIYDQAEEILGWAHLSVAGGFVESMAVTPAADGSLDVVTLLIRREVNGQTVRHVEDMAMPFGALSEEMQPRDACHMFAAIQFLPALPTQVFTLPHLVGETVCAWTSEGSVLDLRVEPGGAVMLPWPVEWAVIGLYDDSHHAELLDIPAQSPEGSTMGRQKKLYDRGGIGLHMTSQLQVQSVQRAMGKAPVFSRPKNIVERPIGATGTNLVSGVAALAPDAEQALELSYRFTPVGGAPATLTAIVPIVQEAGR